MAMSQLGLSASYLSLCLLITWESLSSHILQEKAAMLMAEPRTYLSVKQKVIRSQIMLSL